MTIRQFFGHLRRIRHIQADLTGATTHRDLAERYQELVIGDD